MKILTDLIHKLEDFERSAEQMAVEVINDNAEALEELNINQLQQGEKADGETMPDYSPRSVKEFGKPVGPIKLFDKGDFYEGIQAQADKNKVTLIGRDSKTKMLTIRFGNILGVQADNLQGFIDIVFHPAYIQKVKEKLFR